MRNSFILTIVTLLIACSDQEQAISEKQLSLGKDVYHDNCAICHGVKGEGDGIALPALTSKPKSILLWNEDYNVESLRLYVKNSTKHPDFRGNLDYQSVLDFSDFIQ
jgi:cytochrome c553